MHLGQCVGCIQGSVYIWGSVNCIWGSVRILGSVQAIFERWHLPESRQKPSLVLLFRSDDIMIKDHIMMNMYSLSKQPGTSNISEEASSRKQGTPFAFATQPFAMDRSRRKLETGTKKTQCQLCKRLSGPIIPLSWSGKGFRFGRQSITIFLCIGPFSA